MVGSPCRDVVGGLPLLVHPIIPQRGGTGTKGQCEPWDRDCGDPWPACLISLVTAASAGAETGLMQWWETGEEMPGQARP